MTNDNVARVKDATDIVKVVESAGIELSPHGANRLVGLCPFHNEKTPSFVVYMEFQTYKCFGCEAHGDAINFYQEYYKADFKEALYTLAEEAGVQLEQGGDEEWVDKKTLYQLLDDAQRFYSEAFDNLPDTHVAVKEVTNRGLSRDVEEFGYADANPRGLLNHLDRKGYDRDSMVKAGVVGFSDGEYYDMWRNRVLMPFKNKQGRVVGLTGRDLTGKAKSKYLHSRTSPVFDKTRVMYGIHQAMRPAKKAGVIYVTEGQFDVLALREMGYFNAVATSGTGFTESHSQELGRLVGAEGSIVVVYDGDNAGQNATLKLGKVATSVWHQMYVARMPDGDDPGDMVASGRGGQLDALINKERTPFSLFVVQRMAEGRNMDAPQERERFLRKVADYASSIDSSGFASALKNVLYTECLYEPEELEKRFMSYEEKAEEERRAKKEKAKRNEIGSILVSLYSLLLFREPGERKSLLAPMKDLIPPAFLPATKKLLQGRPSDWSAEGKSVESEVARRYMDCPLNEKEREHQVKYLLERLRNFSNGEEKEDRVRALRKKVKESDSLDAFEKAARKI